MNKPEDKISPGNTGDILASTTGHIPSENTSTSSVLSIRIKEELNLRGFNLTGICLVRDYDLAVKPANRLSPVFPGMKSIILFGSGGRGFWKYLRDFTSTPEGFFLKKSSDPIDNYSEYTAESIKKMFPELIREIIYPFKSEKILTDFSSLAILSGFGYFSPVIKLLIHPLYGSWVSLRGAFLSDVELIPTGIIRNFSPCTDCTKPCLNVCPATAVSEYEFDFRACFEYRNNEQDCISFCKVRKACIIGPEHSYSEEEGMHRNKSSLLTLRNYFNQDQK